MRPFTDDPIFKIERTDLHNPCIATIKEQQLGIIPLDLHAVPEHKLSAIDPDHSLELLASEHCEQGGRDHEPVATALEACLGFDLLALALGEEA